MERSYLVQRLKRPFKHPNAGLLNGVFSFGMVEGGGFNKDALKILSTVCNFDYMGASEFEWGAVPKAFGKIWERTHDVAFSFSLPMKAPKSALVAMDIYGFCPPEWKEEVIKRITGWAVMDEDLKETTGLPYILKGYNYGEPVVGWIELDNGFMFFIDPVMADSFYKLLVKKEAVQ